MRTGAGNYFRDHTVKERKSRWFVFANQTGAVFYRDLPDQHFQFVDRLENPAGSRMESDFDSDRPGSGMSSAGGGTIRHSLDRTFHHAEWNVEHFAGAVARRLEEALGHREFTELVMVAEPRFLGVLRSKLSPGVKERVRHEVHRELIQGSDEELRTAAIRAIRNSRKQ
jgi:protein required for attachment to host cells